VKLGQGAKGVFNTSSETSSRSRRHADDCQTVSNICDNGSPRTHRDVHTNPNSLPNHRANADPTLGAHMDVSSQPTARTDVHALTENAIVIHGTASINNASQPNSGADVDDRAGNHNCSGGNFCLRTDTCVRMDDRSDPDSPFSEARQQRKAYRCATNRNKYLITFAGEGRNLINLSNHGPNQISAKRGPAIVKKYNFIPSLRSQGAIRNYPTVAACTYN
jgi:hypothetical protein